MGNELVRMGLEKGFLNDAIEADDNYVPKLVLNQNTDGCQSKVGNVIKDELENCNEFSFSVAFITVGGVAWLQQTLEELRKKNVKGKILASQYLNFTQPDALRKIKEFNNIELRIVTDEGFHAKGYIFKKEINGHNEYSMIIGSSNLTGNALGKHNEWNVKLASGEDGGLIKQISEEFDRVFARSTPVNDEWLNEYQKIYEATKQSQHNKDTVILFNKINPNKMQVEALSSIDALRKEGKTKAILISATGTGKTYLSAFDVRRFKPKRFLFIVHRDVILKAAMDSYRMVMGPTVSMGIYNGREKSDAQYLFASIQTLSKKENMESFATTAFDYIVVDEVHRSGAQSYQNVLNYFKPKFMLGMTATPERTDGVDIFKMFDNNIAYEIRLQRALEEELLVPFHYHGVSELAIDDQEIDDKTKFSILTADERIKHIMKKSEEYGCDHGRIKALVFCRSIEEANELEKKVREQYGKRTKALLGSHGTEERQTAIERLQTDIDDANALDYIFTVDIFNEGVDIPKVNQIIMLRPTQSVIVFVQQLGRGLRKSEGKEYLQVIDFIANYDNNYMIPIALYGDRTYNKDHIRKTLTNNCIPGSSTVEFDAVAKKRIFDKIDKITLNSIYMLKQDYNLLKYQLGRRPMMMDFINRQERDPYTILEKMPSYYEFVCRVEEEAVNMPINILGMLQFISQEVADGKRIEEVIILKSLINSASLGVEQLKEEIKQRYGIDTSNKTILDVVSYLDPTLFNPQGRKKYGLFSLLKLENGNLRRSTEFTAALQNTIFTNYLQDTLNSAEHKFEEGFNINKYSDGFIVSNKYSRKDVCRILGWEKDESSTIYGYRVKYGTCPIFVTYMKDEDIAGSTKYEDQFLNNKQFSWFTRNRVTLVSDEVQAIKDPNTRILLFVKQSNGEGSDFYYMGDVVPHNLTDAFIETTIKNDANKILPIVNITFDLKYPITNDLLKYFKA